MKWGPTSANCSPVRILFLRTQAAKDKLRPLLSPGNVAKTDAAPITAIIGYDTEFHRHLSRLFPHNPTVKDNFRGPKNTANCEQTAFRHRSEERRVGRQWVSKGRSRWSPYP